eukprot:CAMPEP_0174316710 /NCGR_PEP_ID=MMETSP0810-20121108/7137_1 /TAXON_ID=73025 ORGANISM="Eutreptiella gymnastica-like, Strain CCMP1594" /NCGR_SAMPLE_ID=MMETSP0810 /ASSEMBLY_ACC=CAM_ASM_000659 /LENGTH=56 /DNA_ID=CAMNT_0015426525 /DNA_START=62 /DNA_END=229 /DNA_ORIENTATION=+
MAGSFPMISKGDWCAVRGEAPWALEGHHQRLCEEHEAHFPAAAGKHTRHWPSEIQP